MESLSIAMKGWEVVKENEVITKNTAELMSIIPSFPREDIEQLHSIGPEQHIKRMFKDMRKCRGKEVEELTDNEKFAICFFSGVEIDYQNWDEETQSFLPVTRFPCGISKKDGKFQVYEGRK